MPGGFCRLIVCATHSPPVERFRSLLPFLEKYFADVGAVRQCVVEELGTDEMREQGIILDWDVCMQVMKEFRSEHDELLDMQDGLVSGIANLLGTQLLDGGDHEDAELHEEEERNKSLVRLTKKIESLTEMFSQTLEKFGQSSDWGARESDRLWLNFKRLMEHVNGIRARAEMERETLRKSMEQEIGELTEKLRFVNCEHDKKVATVNENAPRIQKLFQKYKKLTENHRKLESAYHGLSEEHEQVKRDVEIYVANEKILSSFEVEYDKLLEKHEAQTQLYMTLWNEANVGRKRARGT